MTQDEALRQMRTLANTHNIVFVAWTATDVIDLYNSLDNEEGTQKPLEEEDADSILDNCAKWLEEIMIERGWEVIQYELDSWLNTKNDAIDFESRTTSNETL